MSEPNILLVEDDTRSARLISTYLNRAGFSTSHAPDGQQALSMIGADTFDLILLDILLPGIDGRKLRRIIRKESDVPIIMVTALGSREDRLEGLDGGADDYIVKPFDPDELVARVRSLLRRTKSQVRETLTCGRLSAERDSGDVLLDGEKLPVTHAQFLILWTLLRQPGVILSRNQIIEQSFSDSFEGYDRAVDSHIRRLRKILDRKGYSPIQTVYGGGYRLVCE
ncbi:MAG: response regulator transcription factor [Sphaerochaetaceae bacterium]|nr:response regulator transcription factor [Sphaerochaetaceae bacterium]